VAWFAGSDQWDHAKGVVITGVLQAGTAAAQIGFAVQTTVPPPPPIPRPNDPGPDKGFDRPGNDYNCFAVNASFTPADCAAACEADGHCMAWTTIDVSEDAQEQVLLPCQHGKPLTSRYCTLKSPVPTVMKPSPSAYTGLPTRSLHNSSHPTKNATSPETVTSMLMEIKPNTDLTRSTRVRDFAVGGAVPPKVRDTTGPFECGDPTQKKSVTCLPATTTGVSVGSHHFLACVHQSVFSHHYALHPVAILFSLRNKVAVWGRYLRHGTFELYVGVPLMLVQTMTYGTYPVASGKVGLATINDTAARFESVKAWEMSL